MQERAFGTLALQKDRGVTLVELMVVVVIIGILAGIAYPSYTSYMRQTRRSDAQIALTKVAAAQEKFYSDCSSYAGNLSGARDCAAGTLGYPAAPILSDERHYVMILVAVTASCPIASCYVLQATPSTTAQGTGQQVGNGNLRINSAGAKTWAKDETNYTFRWTDK